MFPQRENRDLTLLLKLIGEILESKLIDILGLLSISNKIEQVAELVRLQ